MIIEQQGPFPVDEPPEGGWMGFEESGGGIRMEGVDLATEPDVFFTMLE